MERFIAVRNTFCLLLLSCAAVTNTHAQQNETSQQAPQLIIDPQIRFGQLDNGLTYYIRHNEMPKERAEFYIVHDVGSMQEEDDQRGLAHFLEHMAFNGTKNFPEINGILDYTEKIGMKFGENVNAYTGFDETVYMLKNVPTMREGIIDSALLILHDWSSFLLLDDEAIEKERGIIREELRTTRTAQMRLWEQQLPKMYPLSKYGKRLPIGTLTIIENFAREDLIDYYNKWYRPDLQALIIVGDIDVDNVEEKVKKVFSDIPKAEDEPEKGLYVVQDNDIPLVSIATDKEMPNTVLYIFYKHDKIPLNLKGTIVDLYTNYTQQIIASVMRERFSEIVQKPDAPFVAAFASDGDFFVSKTKGAWTSAAIAKPNELDRAMKGLVVEVEKIKKFGFTEDEYERAKDNVLKMYENAFNERNNQNNSSLAGEYIGHFTNADYIPGIEIEYEIVKEIAPVITLEGLNNYLNTIFKKNENFRNIVIGLTGPDMEDMIYPSEQELLMMFVEAQEELVENNEAEEINRILLHNTPDKGRIVSESKNDMFDNYEFTLSNGAKVVVKQTENKNDEILMSALRIGGETTFKNKKDIWNLKLFNNAIQFNKIGDFSATNLMKALSGKKVNFSMGIAPSSDVINGSSSPADLKTLFEIIYLLFTDVQPDHEAYTGFKERVIAQLENLNLNPDYTFTDSLKAVLYNNSERDMNLKVTDFEKIDYDRIIAMYKERFSDASNFTFTFVGNIELDTIKPLMETYLASLPKKNNKSVPDESQMTPFPKGNISKHYRQKLETPKATIHLMYTGKMTYNLSNIVKMQVLNGILDLVFYEKVRESERAAYYILNEFNLYDFPLGRMTHQINFDTSPDKITELIDIVKTEVTRIAEEGTSNENFEKTLLSIVKKSSELIQRNEYWLGILGTYYLSNFDSHTDYIKILGEINEEDIKKFAKEFLEQGNLIELVMIPE